MNIHNNGYLILEDGTRFEGRLFGHPTSVSGEVVFSTGMVGYTEALTDPSFYGQILTLTYPLIGNYGVGDPKEARSFESVRIQAKGLIVSEYSDQFAHHDACMSLDAWLKSEKIPALTGVDTRALTQHLREKGACLGKIIAQDQDVEWYDPNAKNLLDEVTISEPKLYNEGGRRRVALLDCGCKQSILTNLLDHDLEVIRLPWKHDMTAEKVDGYVISSGPGDPALCTDVIEQVKKIYRTEKPLLGICLGHQVMALAAGAKTFKLKFGHRSQNQPVRESGTNRCYVTSQNHGFAVDNDTLPKEWKPYFNNLNDHTNEGIIHESGRFLSVQFHPEAAPGPYDTSIIFTKFTELL